MSKQGGEEAEVYAAMEERWRESNSGHAELGLIAEEVGLPFEGEPTALEAGSVLAAVRHVIRGTDHE